MSKPYATTEAALKHMRQSVKACAARFEELKQKSGGREALTASERVEYDILSAALLNARAAALAVTIN